MGLLDATRNVNMVPRSPVVMPPRPMGGPDVMGAGLGGPAQPVRAPYQPQQVGGGGGNFGQFAEQYGGGMGGGTNLQSLLARLGGGGFQDRIDAWRQRGAGQPVPPVAAPGAAAPAMVGQPVPVKDFRSGLMSSISKYMPSGWSY